MERIIINSGLKSYEIADEEGNVKGVISFNPTDLSIYTKAEKLVKYIDTALYRIAKITAENANNSDILTEIDEHIKNSINDIFGNNASDIVFGNQHSLSLSGGESLALKFILQFMPIMQKNYEQEMRNSKERIAKYVGDSNDRDAAEKY